MGCSCDKKSIPLKDKTENEYSQSNKFKNDEEDILILNEMLVNENKGDVSHYYIPMQTIGQGSFGKVFKVKQKVTGNIFAMKLINKNTEVHNSENKNFLNEIYILRQLDHPNILKVYEYFSNEKYWYFVMEYISGGNNNEFFKINEFFRIILP